MITVFVGGPVGLKTMFLLTEIRWELRFFVHFSPRMWRFRVGWGNNVHFTTFLTWRSWLFLPLFSRFGAGWGRAITSFGTCSHVMLRGKGGVGWGLITFLGTCTHVMLCLMLASTMGLTSRMCFARVGHVCVCLETLTAYNFQREMVHFRPDRPLLFNHLLFSMLQSHSSQSKKISVISPKKS